MSRRWSTCSNSRALERLNVNGFEDYTKYLPNVTFQTLGPDTTSVYIRGVSSGDNANHSGPLPTVGVYLDEQPITTIGGTLDVHIYDIARVEVLEGPQGTLYGASSEAGTLRIITNQPSTAGFKAGFDLQGDYTAHGGPGYVAEGFVNIPITDKIAVRLVGFDEYDHGFIDNVPGSRPFATSGNILSNSRFVANSINKVENYGGRAAVRFDINDSWNITPTVIAQDLRSPGVFGFDPYVGDLKVQRFAPDSFHDRWLQTALTINGKIGRFDLTYSGGYFNRKVNSLSDYTDYSVAYDQAYGSGANWQDSTGTPLPYPQQEIVGRDRFEKGSNELRIASPSSDRFRFVAGLFQERQSHWIIQDYQIQGFGPQIAVPGWPNTIWLTDQDRVDRDEAVFAEASFDVTPKITITGGIRGYHYKNSLYGFFGFSANYDALTGFSSGMGVDNSNCLPGQSFRNAPCVNLNKVISDSGETHRVNASYKFDSDRMIYFTYSTGFRPGGVNRNGGGAVPPYSADTLDNYEVGWKTRWFDRSLTWNGAVYDEEWNKFQFSFLGLNSLTIVDNAPQARILGIESNVEWRATSQLTLSAAGAYNRAYLTQVFCGANPDTGQVITGCTETDPAVAGQVAYKGTQLPYTPRFKGNITARYTWNVGPWSAHAQGAVFYQSRENVGLRKSDIDALGEIPGYATADFSVGAERGRTSLELFIKNAFDTRGQLNRFTPCTVSVCASAYPNAAPSGFVSPALYEVPIHPLTVGIKLGETF